MEEKNVHVNNEELKVHVNNNPTYTSPIWFIGFLFTLGYLFSVYQKVTFEWFEYIYIGIITYVLWPLILGIEIAKVLK